MKNSICIQKQLRATLKVLSFLVLFIYSGIRAQSLSDHLTVVNNASCSGACNGTLLVSVSGGAAPYQFIWSSGVENTGGTSTTDTAYNLCAGSYSVTIIDASNDTVISNAPISAGTNKIDTIAQTICYGTSYDGHTTSGTYSDTFLISGGCDSIRVLNLTVGQTGWIKKNNFAGTGRQDDVTFTIGNLGYLGTGGASVALNDFWQYNPTTDSWTQEANVPGSDRSGAMGFALNGKGYIGSGVTGGDGTILQDFYQYNPSTNTWAQKNNLPGGAARWGAVAVVANNKAYFGFGNFAQLDGAVLADDWYVYNDTTDSWTSLASFPSGGRMGPAAFYINSVSNTVYVGTGWDGSKYDNDMWAYNITANTWTQKNNFPGVGRCDATAFALQNNGYLGLGGYTTPTDFSDFYQYNPTNDSWTTMPAYPSGGLVGARAIVIGSDAYVICGENYNTSTETNLVYAWGPSSVIQDTVTTTICLGLSYDGHSSSGVYIDTLTSSGGCDSIRVLNLTVLPLVTDTINQTICAGQSYDGYYSSGTYKDTFSVAGTCDSIRVLNLSVSGQNGWIKKNTFPGAGRQNHVTFTINNEGYLGPGGNGTGQDDFWQYNPSTDSWTQKANVPGGNRSSEIGFALNGFGYIGSGVSGPGGTILQDFWQYNPSTNTWAQKNNLPGGAGRWGALAIVANNNAYFGFGNFAQLDGAVLANDLWVYNDASDTWTSLANFPSGGRLGAIAFYISSASNTIYVGTGWDGSRYDNDIWAYNITSNTWTQKNNFPGVGRCDATAFAIGNNGYLGLGGYTTPTDFSDFYEYNTTNDSWTTMPVYPAGGLVGARPFVIGSYAYVTCGENYNTGTETAQVYAWGPTVTQDTITATVCSGQSYNGYTVSGYYADTLTGSSGCDSIVILKLTVLPQTADTINQTICSGSSYDGHSSTGIYTDTLKSSGGCDSIVVLNLTVSGQGGWIKKNNFAGTGRQNHVTFTINNLGYLGTGGSSTALDDFWQYNPSTDSWTQEANVPGGTRSTAIAFALNGFGYIGSGVSGAGGTILQDFWQYNPSTNTWTQKNNLPGGEGRWGAVAIVANGNAYFGFGNFAQLDEAVLAKDWYVYNASNDSWTSLATFPSAGRLDPVAFYINSVSNTIYVGTGWDGSKYDNDIWAYNITSNSWTQKNNFPGLGRCDATAFAIQNNGYLGLGGYTTPTDFSDFYQYNPTNDSWTTMPAYPAGGLVGASAFVVGSFAYVTCGENYNTSTETNLVYAWGPSSVIQDTVTTTICLGLSYDGHSSPGVYIDTLTSSGGCDSIRVLNLTVLPLVSDTINQTICAGQSFDGYYSSGTYRDTFSVAGTCDSIRVLNLSVSGQNGWIKKNIFPGAGRQNLVTFTINNLGYVGPGGNGSGQDDFWQYNPTTDSWTQKANVPGGNRASEIGFALNGMGYIGSGVSGSGGTILQDFWQYNPSTNTWTQKNNLPGGAGRWGALAIVANNNAYFGFGDFAQLDGAVLANDLWVYNSTNDTWSSLTNFPAGGRLNPAAFYINSVSNTIYFGTGWDGSRYDNDIWAYNITTNTWTQKNNFPGVGRCDATAFAIQNNGYLGLGGYITPTAFSDFYEYNPANDSWTTMPAFPSGGFVGASSFVVGSYGYVTCGYNYGGTESTQVYSWGPSSIQDTVTKKLCFGQSYAGYSVSGIYVDTLTGSSGCDSIRVVNLTILPQNVDTISQAICSGSYDGHSTTGTYVDTFSSANGCDSIRWLNLSVIPLIKDTISQTMCTGQSYAGFNTSGKYIDTFTTSGGCDSIRVLNLTVLPQITDTINQTVCAGQTYDGYFSSGIYHDTFSVAGACDSIRVLNLTVSGQNGWVKKNTFPGAGRQNHVTFTINNKGYMGPGGNGGGQEDFWQYDPATDSWTEQANVPGGTRASEVGFALNGMGYIGSGVSGSGGNILHDLWQYNPSTNAWTQKNNMPGEAGRWGAIAIVANNNAYFGFGDYAQLDGAVLANDWWVYNDDNDSWTSLASFPSSGRLNPTAFYVNSNGSANTIYVGTGWDGSGYDNDMWAYNITSNTWTQKNNFPGAGRCDATAFAIGNNGYMGLGGYATPTVFSDFYEYNPTSDSWTSIPSFPSGGFVGASAFVVGSYAFVTCGYNYGGTESSQVYAWGLSVIQDTISATICQGGSYDGHTASGTYIDTLNSSGGCDSIRVLNLTISGSNSWIKKNNFPGAGRQNHVTFTINNVGYMGPGANQTATAQQDFWSYDPAADSWTQKANVPGGPRGSEIGFALNGMGYLGSGVSGSDGSILQDFWQYNPSTNTWTQKNNLPGGAGRWGAMAIVANNNAYFGFGNYGQLDGAVLANDLWVYNVANDTWTSLTNFPSAGRLGPAAFYINSVSTANTIYIGTGWDGYQYDNDIWAYNITSNTWTQKNNFPGVGRTDATAFAIGNNGYMGLGGYATPTAFSDFYEYNPTSDSWTTMPAFPSGGFVGARAFVVGSYAYVTCGYNYGGTESSQVYAWGSAIIQDSVYASICQGLSYDGHSTSGIYTDTLTSSGGCDSIRVLTLTVLPQIVDTVSQYICSGQSYDGHTVSGTFIDTLTAVSGCDSIVTVNLFVGPQINDTINQVICTGVSYDGYTISGTYVDTFTATGGCDSVRTLNLTVTPPIEDTISQLIYTGQSYDGHNTTGLYVDTLVAAGGCDSIRTLYLRVAVGDTVWPGDANNDGVANYLDMLTLGLAYQDTGSVRPNHTNNWIGQRCPIWGDTLPNGPNANHADCNGDGVVNANDTVPILLNYSMVHNKTQGTDSTPGAPPIYFIFYADSVGTNTPVNVGIGLGTPTDSAENVLGIGFTINFSSLLVQDSTAAFYAINSWLGTPGTDLIYLQKGSEPGSVDVGITRIDHDMRNGAGVIGNFTFVTIDNLSGKTNGLNDTLKLTISGIKMIMNDGTVLPVNQVGNSTTVYEGINTPGNNNFDLTLYPNPTAGTVNYVVRGLTENATLTLEDLTGRILFSGEIASGKGLADGQLDLSGLSKGVYFFRMNTPGGNVVKKIVLQ